MKIYYGIKDIRLFIYIICCLLFIAGIIEYEIIYGICYFKTNLLMYPYLSILYAITWYGNKIKTEEI